MKPLVSIIVATYRRDLTLKRALLSLAEQSYSTIEIILVDDNANPEWNQKVENIVSEFENSISQIQICYIQNASNQGSAVTRNIGIGAAQGEYITFLDDDDIYLPRKVENQVLFMQDGGFDYSITNLELFNENEKLVDKRTRSYIRETSTQALFEYHLKYHMTGTDTMMFRKDYLTEIGGFPHIDVGDEFYLFQRAIENGGKFGYISVCDVKAYVHTGEMGLSSGQSKIEGENALYEHKKKYFTELNKNTVKYIKARHYAVLAYAYLRTRCLNKFITNVIRGFTVSPFLFFNILLKR